MVNQKNSHRDYVRRNYISTSKGLVRCVKRIRPGRCELCEEPEKVVGRLHYHHWNDQKLYWGIYVCWSCHKACEVFERGLDQFSDKYSDLKKEVEMTWGGTQEDAVNILKDYHSK